MERKKTAPTTLTTADFSALFSTGPQILTKKRAPARPKEEFLLSKDEFTSMLTRKAHSDTPHPNHAVSVAGLSSATNLTAGSSAAYPVTIDEDVTASTETNLTTLAPSVSPQSTSLYISPLALSSTFIASGAPSKSPRASNADLPGFVAPAAGSSAANPLVLEEDAAALAEDGVIELAPRMRSGFSALPSSNSVLPASSSPVAPYLTRTAAAKPLQSPDYPSNCPPNIHVIMLVWRSAWDQHQHTYWHKELGPIANGLVAV
jgi:hypothetical protein